MTQELPQQRDVGYPRRFLGTGPLCRPIRKRSPPSPAVNQPSHVTARASSSQIHHSKRGFSAQKGPRFGASRGKGLSVLRQPDWSIDFSSDHITPRFITSLLFHFSGKGAKRIE
jgi:hypothetical protein